MSSLSRHVRNLKDCADTLDRLEPDDLAGLDVKTVRALRDAWDRIGDVLDETEMLSDELPDF